MDSNYPVSIIFGFYIIYLVNHILIFINFNNLEDFKTLIEFYKFYLIGIVCAMVIILGIYIYARWRHREVCI